MKGFRIRPADLPWLGLRYDYEDGEGLKIHGFAKSEKAAMREIRRRVRRYRKMNRLLDD